MNRLFAMSNSEGALSKSCGNEVGGTACDGVRRRVSQGAATDWRDGEEVECCLESVGKEDVNGSVK
jgi:hypothetical protein